MPWEPRMRHEAGTPRTRGLRAHAVAVLAAAFGLTAPAAGHKPITSPFTFYEDVLPITQARCGSCHAPDGVAPMSLLTHEAAVPWAESLRLELVASRMPPGSDVWPRDRVRHTAPLTARELTCC